MCRYVRKCDMCINTYVRKCDVYLFTGDSVDIVEIC